MWAAARSLPCRPTPAAHASTLLGWAQDLGANFVRLAHYQHDEHMVREADRRGLLAWCELPVYWGIAFDRPDVLANAQEQLEELAVAGPGRDVSEHVEIDGGVEHR